MPAVLVVEGGRVRSKRNTPTPPTPRLFRRRKFTTPSSASFRRIETLLSTLGLSLTNLKSYGTIWGMKYVINLEEPEGLYQVAVGIMEQTRCCFSVILDRESRRPESERQWIEGYCPSWLRLKGEMRRRGLQGILAEIVALEAELLSDNLEREMYEGYNAGDVERVILATKTLAGVLSKAKMYSGKMDSDVKHALINHGLKNDSLKQYGTDELKKLLARMKDEEGDDGDK